MASRQENTVLRAIRRRSALFGLAIIVIFLLIASVGAATAPYSNGYSPTQFDVAAPTALPAWMSFIPGFSNLPPNIVFPASQTMQTFQSTSAVTAWQPTDPANVTVQYSSAVGPTGMTPPSRAYQLVNSGPGSELINMSGDSKKAVDLNFEQTLSYNYKAPDLFSTQVAFDPKVVQGAGVAVLLYVRTDKGVYPLALEADFAGETALESGSSANSYLTYFTNPIISPLENNTWNYVSGVTTATQLMPLYYLNSTLVSGLGVTSIASTIFQGVTSYTVGELVQIFPQGHYSVEIYQSDLKYQVFGSLYGLLGTDVNGADVWSEFSIGAGTALGIAFGATAIVLAIGITVGLISGFFGGLVDNTLILVIDFLLLIPFLVLLVDLDTVFTLGHILPNKVLLLILLFGVLSWPGLARTIRSQVLSLRSRTYIVAAGAMGASRMYVLRRHILNHTFGTILALTVFLIPGLLIADVGVDYLGLGITQTPTWGNMTAYLINDVSPANSYLWWITLPLTISIIVLSASFFLVGRSIQQEFSRVA